MRRRGFTLIELLVTIAIIAVIIGILLPVLPRVRDAGRRTACSATLRSLGQSLELYKNDSKEIYPVARYMPEPWLSGIDAPALPVALASYSDGIADDGKTPWRCAGDRLVASREYAVTSGPGAGQTRVCGMSYMYVTVFGGRTFEQTPFARRLRLTPSDAPVSYDFDGGTFETESGDEVTVPFFHATRMVLFVDGRVAKYPEYEMPEEAQNPAR